ncbi:hypothetical protein ACPUEN_08965 [Algoriphagus yeomjeoni]|uniref:hypothetical protein n=1 Tax=Algoriphagus yeomjeoni TaxID=291403 RepID=UPI003CE474EA
MIRQTKSPPSQLYLIMGFVGLFAVLVGFSTTFIIPVSRNTFIAPPLIYIHGALAMCWVSLYLLQVLLIRSKNLKIHKQLGIIGLLIALSIVVTLLPTGMHQVERELAEGLGQTATSSLVGILFSGLIFGGLVISGIANRKMPCIHRNFMLLATLVLIWPGWFRFRHLFPNVSDPAFWFGFVLADTFIVISILWDRVVHGKFNTTLLTFGLLIILENTLELYFFDSPWWQELANKIYFLIKK